MARGRERSASLDSLGRRKRRTAAVTSVVVEATAADEAGALAVGVAVAVGGVDSSVAATVEAEATVLRVARLLHERRMESETQEIKGCVNGTTKEEERAEKTGSGTTTTTESAAPAALSHLSEEEQMQMLLGFGGFDSTKGKSVEDNAVGPAAGAARKETKREYRQYMNRRGGFNRPLDH
ncbi:hypothetical protein PINS_up010210 [Pythium insidiosum]|nr:hypothetical protein PINS_up010210 [Pythium insidiosum]